VTPTSHVSRVAFARRRVGVSCSILIPFVSLLVSAALPSAEDNQLLDYGPYKGYDIGMGILGTDYSTPLGACVTGTKSPLSASRTESVVSIVYNASQYEHSFHIDQKADASFLGMGGGGDELHFGQEINNSSTAFTIIVETHGEVDSQTLGNIKWDEPYKARVESGDPEKIRQVRRDCGDRFIQTVFKQKRLFVVLGVSSQQSSMLTTFRGSANGSFNLDVVSASASLGGDDRVRSANQAGAISAHIYSEGIEATPTLAIVGIGAADGLSSIASKLETYLSGVKTPGQPVKYRLAPLPGLPRGTFTDDRMTEYLGDLKHRYLTAKFRLDNLKSLSSPNDPRRSLLLPQADGANQRTFDALSAYSDVISNVHTTCRQALVLTTCAEALHGVGVPPSVSNEEMPPIVPPLIGWYEFGTDGVPVPFGQASVVVDPSSSTLLNGGRRVKQDSATVDLVAPLLGSDYIATIDPYATSLHPGPTLQTIAGPQLVGSDLEWPEYWKQVNRPGAAVVSIAHADAQVPCPIHRSQAGRPVLDETCLTPTGHLLVNLAMADLAASAASGPGSSDLPLSATTTNCFAMTQPVPLAEVQITAAALSTVASPFKPPPPQRLTAQVDLSVWIGSRSLLILERKEEHTITEWKGLAEARIAALQVNASSASVGKMCSPRRP
jgi:hypothetical protein